MYNNITNYPIYKKTIELYKDHVDYKGNEKKLREEAIGKLIADRMVNSYENTNNQRQVEQVNNWWTALWNKIKSLFTKVKSDPYTKAAYDILERNITELKAPSISTQANILNKQDVIEYLVQDLDPETAEIMRKDYQGMEKGEFNTFVEDTGLSKMGNYWTTGEVSNFHQIDKLPIESWNALPFTSKGMYKFDYKRTISEGETAYNTYVDQFGENNVSLLPSTDSRYKSKIAIRRPTVSGDVIEDIVRKEDSAMGNMKELAKAPFEFKSTDLVKNFDEFFEDELWLESIEKENRMRAIEMGEDEIICTF
jgi:hypothetical protein